MADKKESKTIRFLGLSIPLLLMGYVLSIGPLVALTYDADMKPHNPQIEKFLIRFYAPLTWVADQNAYLGQAFISYIEFCRGSEITDAD